MPIANRTNPSSWSYLVLKNRHTERFAHVLRTNLIWTQVGYLLRHYNHRESDPNVPTYHDLYSYIELIRHYHGYEVG